MEKRSSYKPFFRINRSILPLGISWEEAGPSLFVFGLLVFFLKDLLVPLILSLSFLVLSAAQKKQHRSGYLKDFIKSFFLGEKIYVGKNRNSKLP